MKAILCTLLLFSASAAAQFESERPLIPKESSQPLAGLPFDALWSRQNFIGEGNDFLSPVDGGWMSLVEHDRIYWHRESRTYHGIHRGRGDRVLPIGKQRIVLEEDQGGSQRTNVEIAEWIDGELRLFDFDIEPDSAFGRHMRSQGVRVDGEGRVDGAPSAVLSALASLPLGKRELDTRRRRPNHAEMGLIWNYFEVVRWVNDQNDRLGQVEAALREQQGLGALHLAHKLASHARYSDLANVASLHLSQFAYGRMGPVSFQRLFDRSSAALDKANAQLEERMEWLATMVEVVEHQKQAPDPAKTWNFVSRPSPGTVLEFHMKATRADGAVLVDTRALEQPVVTPLMGELPEGLQYALRILGYEESITVRIPPQLGFGEEHGVVEVTLDIVDSHPDGMHVPPTEGLLFIHLAPVDAEETPSGLRYREIVAGEGASPSRGDKVTLRIRSWNVFEKVIEVPREATGTVGGEDLMAGVSEALMSMKVGGLQVLFVPPHLADTHPERSGMAQCVVVELLSIDS